VQNLPTIETTEQPREVLLEMDEEFERREIPVKEYGERTFNAARLYSLLRQECDL
jgi:hypothetical protein